MFSLGQRPRYGYECPTELTEVLCRVIPGVNTPDMVLYVPYRTQPWNRAYCFPHAIDRRYKQHLYVLGTTVVYSIYQDIHQCIEENHLCTIYK